MKTFFKFACHLIETLRYEIYLGAVGLQELHYVRMFQHVTYGGLPFEVVEAEARAGGELGHVDNLDRKLLAGLPMNTSSDQGKRTFSCKLKK